MTQEIPIRVRGKGFNGRTVKPEAQASFVRRTQVALRDAVRFKTVRTTRLKGRPFEFLSRTWDIEQAPWQETDGGDTLLVFQVPKLKDSAPRLFEQETLFEEDRLQPDWTAFDLLGQVITAVQDQTAKEMAVDYGMLSSLEAYNSDLKKGLELASFDFEDSALHTAIINDHLTEKAQEVLEFTPTPRLIRIVGKLDMLRMSDHLFQLITGGNAKVRGIWTPDRISLKDFFGEEVYIEGKASYRPNGGLASIEASAVRRATEEDDQFRQLPKVASAQIRLDISDRSDNGFGHIIGKWPGDESDDDIRAWLQELS